MIASVPSPLLVKKAVDLATHGLFTGGDEVVFGLLGLAVLQFGCGYARSYFAGRLSLDVQHDLRCALLASLVRLDGPARERLHTGQVVSRAMTDLQLVQALLSTVPLTVGCAVLLACSFIAMIWLSPLLASVSLILLPLLGVLTARGRATLFPATWASQQSAADITQHVEETVTGVRVVKGFAQEARELDTMRGRALRLYRHRLRAARLTARLSPLVTSLPSLALVAVIGLGGWLALRGEITLGTLLAFCAYAAHVHLPLGGQGMNLGLQDALNLGWRLAATVHGWAPPELVTATTPSGTRSRRVLRTTRAHRLLLDWADTPRPDLPALRELVATLTEIPAAAQRRPLRRHTHGRRR